MIVVEHHHPRGVYARNFSQAADIASLACPVCDIQAPNGVEADPIGDSRRFTSGPASFPDIVLDAAAAAFNNDPSVKINLFPLQSKKFLSKKCINIRTLLFISRTVIPCGKIVRLAFAGAASSRDVPPPRS